ncbi:uncharacterized protein DUF1206 [Murinocardiopsis flavida]|uniref:Uncharacterized protein DUF1206 n=1 Tax=Murinocardiopsis flavida TaxID=645275 RepID=A0A2P8DH93_9ACTN|nr:DUF1206 domain-containing protein [Murinocardiopsis flavida]PSK96575.1 uncharacterized protein DUF1206 [Murinocardiopsis flavida]
MNARKSRSWKGLTPRAKASNAGHDAAGSTWLVTAARAGLAAKGLFFLLIGFIALQVAYGDSGGRNADNAGALQMVAQNPMGTAVLAACAVGLAGLALWQALIAVLGRRANARTAAERLGCAGRAVVYAALCTTIATFLLGGGTTSQDQQSASLTAQAMKLPAGQLLVGAVALGFIGAGGYFCYKGASKQFLKEIALGGTSRGVRTAVTRLGQVGHVTKGVVVMVAGGLIGYAAVTFDPEKAQGLDGTLRAVADAPYGPWLLTFVAAGVAVYGVYCFCEARWPRV